MADDFLLTVASDKGPVEPIPVTLTSGGKELVMPWGGTVTPLGYQQLTNAQLSEVSALSVPTGATIAVIQNNGNQAVRWRDDGPAPDETLGQRIIAGAILIYTSALSSFKTVREFDGATLDIAYYG